MICAVFACSNTSRVGQVDLFEIRPGADSHSSLSAWTQMHNRRARRGKLRRTRSPPNNPGRRLNRYAWYRCTVSIDAVVISANPQSDRKRKIFLCIYKLDSLMELEWGRVDAHVFVFLHREERRTALRGPRSLESAITKRIMWRTRTRTERPRQQPQKAARPNGRSTRVETNDSAPLFTHTHTHQQGHAGGESAELAEGGMLT